MLTSYGLGGQLRARSGRLSGSAAAQGGHAASPSSSSSTSEEEEDKGARGRRQQATGDDPWSHWRFFQPFRGGKVFIATQGLGWGLFGLAMSAFFNIGR